MYRVRPRGGGSGMSDDDDGDALDAIAADLGTVDVTDAELSTECRAPEGEAFGYDPDR